MNYSVQNDNQYLTHSTDYFLNYNSSNYYRSMSQNYLYTSNYNYESYNLNNSTCYYGSGTISPTNAATNQNSFSNPSDSFVSAESSYNLTPTNTKKRQIQDIEQQVCDTSNYTRTKSTTNKRQKLIKFDFLDSQNCVYKCELCVIEYTSAAKFILHQHKVHNRGSPNACPICDKKFNSKTNILTHLRSHTKEKLFKCKECEAHFSDRSALIKHQRIHTGEKPFECSICYRKFTQSSNLKRHMNTHENQNSQSVFQFPIGDQVSFNFTKQIYPSLL
jgi:uncharacterized Zn-finger protein